MAKTLTLKTILKDKRGSCEKWFGTLRGRKAIDMEIEKQMFGEQMFAGPCRGSETERNLNKLC